MIFVPCKDGLSHNPAEYCSPEDVRVSSLICLLCVLNAEKRFLLSFYKIFVLHHNSTTI